MSPRLGTCCGCGGLRNVTNVVMLPLKAPIPGRGWGCVVCGLPGDGAIAVLCDECMVENTPIVEACRGYPAKDGRIAFSQLTGTHEHDIRKHVELLEPTWQ